MIVLSSATSPVLSISAARIGPRSERKPTADGLPSAAGAGLPGLAAVLVTGGVGLPEDVVRNPPRPNPSTATAFLRLYERPATRRDTPMVAPGGGVLGTEAAAQARVRGGDGGGRVPSGRPGRRPAVTRARPTAS